MVVHCAQVRYSLKHHYSKDANSVAQAAPNGVKADFFPNPKGLKFAKAFKPWKHLSHFDNQSAHSPRQLRPPRAISIQSRPGQNFSKSLEHLPSITVTLYSGRVVRRQSSLNQLDVFLDSKQRSDEDAVPTSRPTSRWNSSVQNGIFVNQRADSVASSGRSSMESPSDATKPQLPSFLPPLPTGSLIFQTCLRDTYFERDGASSSCSSEAGSSESGSDGSSPFSARRRKKTKLTWCGPIVEYKGHHIYLSTLNNIHLNLGRYGNRRWQ